MISMFQANYLRHESRVQVYITIEVQVYTVESGY